MSEYPTCNLCGKSDKTVTFQPSVNQLVFGGFPVRMTNRCAECDKQVAKNLLGTLK